ncbi:hypothetical protein BDN70DRAFT_329239 [Pholiota conissans]|uniref:Uncharacterized protein n=1 Tax=Pholiota conissans TaxID=109636 RepID=A0A9P5Z9J9_9AGAR|nr:hypothetical protein BDN70DRAFT_329239 [Pholiota conissans]
MTTTEGSSTSGPRKGIAKWFEDIRFGVEKKIKDTSSIRKIKSFDVKTTAAPKLLGDNKSHPPDAVQDAAFETDTVPPASYWDASYWVSNVKRKRNSSSSSSYGDINSTFSRSSAGSLGAHSIGSNRSISLSTPFPYPMDIPPLPPKSKCLILHSNGFVVTPKKIHLPQASQTVLQLLQSPRIEMKRVLNTPTGKHVK